VWVKLDNTQQTGSFKLRGLGNNCTKAVKERGCKHIISSSGGNAGLAAACSARKLGVKATIFVPKTTPEFMRHKMTLEGANVIVHGNIWAEAHQQAIEKLKELKEIGENTELIHPFDHPEIWEGNSTIILECHKQIQKPSAIITVVGGGGLLCGILQGMHKIGWDDVPVFACETYGAHSFAEAVKQGELVTLPDITSIAKTLGASRVCEEVFNWTKKHKIFSCVVTDKEAVESIIHFQNDHQILVEPSCAAGLAILYDKEKRFLSKVSDLSQGILMILCGGNMVNIDIILKWKEFFEL
jgi:L-serine/L-threonine ammonia-lyase